MKKLSVAVMVLTLVASMFGVAVAGMGGGCGNCQQQGAASDPFKKYQADTIDLRQEMMIKRFDVQRENLKATPDKEKIAQLQAEIKVLQTRILDVRSQSGLPTDKCDGECDQKRSWCDKQGKGKGDCGKGNGGCNNTPCGVRN